MNKQVAAVAGAVVLAVLGFWALWSYAQGADERAFEGTERVTVLRVTTQVETKTPAAELAEAVESVDLPKAAVVPDAISDLADVEGLVTRGVLVPGDQLSGAKFGPADDVEGESAVPEGLQELSFALEGQRIIGGSLLPGDRVGVYASYPRRTANPLNEVLVLRVDGGIGEGEASAGATVTVAVDSAGAKTIVHALEFGSVWLSKQNEATDVEPGATITEEDVAP